MESSEKLEEYKRITDEQQKLQFELIKEGVPVEVLNRIFNDARSKNSHIPYM
ncbi:hypothetical protein [Methanococcus maripaludis]|uniref:Uncharacterized protein n=1 Tax=Methanococcus maripaludis TaxID=39152 RepID=A0A2L1C9Q9_METMI|nr:hypothetical protein [Methanococcus maripaludis]AVB76095.1 hypothetical protein MMJJ_06810 [Methanococcus maripaludis]